MTTYKLTPAIGVARLGNSPNEFYLAPLTIGGMPGACDDKGNATGETVVSFKDAEGRVKRMGQPFRILQTNDQDETKEITLKSPDVKSIEWTVHLANKKAAWYQFSELQGNLLLGEANSYANQEVPLRNPDKASNERQKLIIDPGPRTISGRNKRIELDRDSIPESYPFGSFPPKNITQGLPINTLGRLITDSEGRLIVLPGYGRAGGDEPISSYGGANSWFDDISDGIVHCRLNWNDGTRQEMTSWIIAGSPNYAPELTNISTLDDTMFDVGVRCFDFVPEMCKNGAWIEDYHADYGRDILPIIQRISGYQWVSNVQSMSAFFSNIFDFSDPSEANKKNREAYFAHFRNPTIYSEKGLGGDSGVLFSHDNIPMMPLNSGTNSVNNVDVEKFLTLDQTQYFLLNQWAKGKFVKSASSQPRPGVTPETVAAVGNCVGLPMSPGIETTWSMQNPNIYKKPFEIAIHGGEKLYDEKGLSPSRDETEGGGCEPGDLTKRMAIPWQADFFNCTVQYVNFTDPEKNKDAGRPLPPTYYAYWWPPQAPWDVLTGDMTPESQKAAGTPAGIQVNYARGINSYVQMIEDWFRLGFVRNQNRDEFASRFPYMVETERGHDAFTFWEMPVSVASHAAQDEETTVPVWYKKPAPEKGPKPAVHALGAFTDASVQDRAVALTAEVEEEIFKPIISADAEKTPMPRRGSRVRF